MDGRIFYNPLAVLGKGKGFAAAIIIVVVLAAIAWWGGIHLDGALDLHVTTKYPSAMLAFAESLIDWLCLGIFLFIASKIFGGNGGIGAHLAATGLSRFPYVIASAVMSRQLLGKALFQAVSVGPNGAVTMRPQDLVTPNVIFALIVLVILVVWSVIILYLGYKEASRLQGGRAVAAFVIGLILAEAISKIGVALVFRTGI